MRKFEMSHFLLPTPEKKNVHMSRVKDLKVFLTASLTKYRTEQNPGITLWSQQQQERPKPQTRDPPSDDFEMSQKEGRYTARVKSDFWQPKGFPRSSLQLKK